MLLVDTSVWSLALRRNRPRTMGNEAEVHVKRFHRALADGEVVLTGVILQEVLQGLAEGPARDRLVTELSKLPLLTPERDDHLRAAEFFTTCRRTGVQLATVDALLSSLCVGHELVMLSTDRDFTHAAPHIGLRLWTYDPVDR